MESYRLSHNAWRQHIPLEDMYKDEEDEDQEGCYPSLREGDQHRDNPRENCAEDRDELHNE